MTWSHRVDAAEMLYLAGGSAPYPQLVKAIEAEAAHVRRVSWTQVV